MILSALIALMVPTVHRIELMPAEALTPQFEISLDRGPAGRFPAGGCLEVEVRLTEHGEVSDARIVRSSRMYPIDRGVLNALKRHQFNAIGLQPGKIWNVYFSWAADGRRTRLSNQCINLESPAAAQDIHEQRPSSATPT